MFKSREQSRRGVLKSASEGEPLTMSIHARAQTRACMHTLLKDKNVEQVTESKTDIFFLPLALSSHGENRSGRSNKFFPVSLKCLCRGVGLHVGGYYENLFLTAAFSINISPRTNQSLESSYGQKVCRVYILNAEKLVTLITPHRSHWNVEHSHVSEGRPSIFTPRQGELH